MNGDMSSPAEECAERLIELVNNVNTDVRNINNCSYETWRRFFSQFLMIERHYRNVRIYPPPGPSAEPSPNLAAAMNRLAAAIELDAWQRERAITSESGGLPWDCSNG